MRRRNRVSALVASLLLMACAQDLVITRPTEDDTVRGRPQLRHALDAAATKKWVFVDDGAPPGGDGTPQSPFQAIGDAVAAANAAGGGRIKLAPGVYPIASTLRVEVPVEIRGSNVMRFDSQGWPTGEITPGTETRIERAAALGAATMLLAGRLDGEVLRNVTIADVTLAYTAATGRALEVIKTQGFTLRNNIVTGSGALTSGAFGITAIASSGRIIGNYITGVGCGACIGAGNERSPGDVEFVGNRSVNNRFNGVLLNGSGTILSELADHLNVTVRGNDLSYNTAIPRFSSGIRVFVIRQDLGGPFNTQQTGNVTAVIKDNRIVGNEIGVIIDAGFPFRKVGAACDGRIYSGTLDVDLRDNILSESRLVPALITFTRSTAALNQATLSLWQYLHGARFTIDDRDQSLAGAWIDHPLQDPVLGECPADSQREALGNQLIVNGTLVPQGRSVP